MLAVCSVVVDVDNSLQPGLFGIAHGLPHTGQPGFVQFVVGRDADMPQPSDRYAHGGEARGGQTVEQGFCGRRVVPSRVRSHTVVESVILVSQVPAQPQPTGYLGRTARDKRRHGLCFAFVSTSSTGGHTQHKK